MLTQLKFGKSNIVYDLETQSHRCLSCGFIFEDGQEIIYKYKIPAQPARRIATAFKRGGFFGSIVIVTEWTEYPAIEEHDSSSMHVFHKNDTDPSNFIHNCDNRLDSLIL